MSSLFGTGSQLDRRRADHYIVGTMASGKNSQIGRRLFNRNLLVGALSLSTSPAFRTQPSDRLGVGLIGAGFRGFQLLSHILKRPDLELVAVADLWSPHFDRLREITQKRSFFTPMFVKVISASEVDCIFVALPDHLQAPVAKAALSAGKQVYAECPATYEESEWQELESVVTRKGTLLFFGCQQLSNPTQNQVKGYLSEGQIGEPEFIDASLSGFVGGYTPVPPDPTLSDRNWRWFLGRNPVRKYDPVHFFQWSRFTAYSVGPAGRHFGHLLGAIYAVLELKQAGAVKAQVPQLASANSLEVPRHLSAFIEYTSGPIIQLSTVDRPGPTRMDITIYGSEGRIEFDSNGVRLFRSEANLGSAHTWPRRRRESFAEKLGIESVQTERPALTQSTPHKAHVLEGSSTALHIERFIHLVRTGRRGIRPGSAHHVDKIGHLVRQAYLEKS